MRTWIMTALLAAALPVPVLAQTGPAPEADLRCVAILAEATGSVEGEARAQMAAAVMYFIGRVDGQAPGTDLKAELKRILPTLTVQMMTDESRRCGAVLVDKGAVLQEIGKDLQAVAQPPASTATPAPVPAEPPKK